MPTETVYGLAARIDSEDGLDRIFSLKGRPSDNPLIIHVSTIEQAKELSDSSAHVLIDLVGSALWPGPLTIVVQKSEMVSQRISGGLNTVAIRMPSHPAALALIQACACPLAAPSANTSGGPSATIAQHVVDDFGQDVMVLDGGACDVGIESTVVRLLTDSCVILRPGATSRETLASVTGLLVIDAGNEVDLMASPGTRYRHYAPRAAIVMVSAVEDLHKIPYPDADRIMILAQPELAETLVRVFPGAVCGSLTQHDLYAELRRADDLDVECIVVLCDLGVRSNEALMDRLCKAASLGKHKDAGT